LVRPKIFFPLVCSPSSECVVYVDRPQRRWRFAELVVTSRRMLQTRPAVFRASLLSQAPGALPRFPHAATRTHELGPPRGATPPICLPATRSRHGRMAAPACCLLPRPASSSRPDTAARTPVRPPRQLHNRPCSTYAGTRRGVATSPRPVPMQLQPCISCSLS
jgi:hypothetical protein